MDIKISEVIKNKRHELNISQEALGDAFGVTVQAVSKWETGLSYPDITMLPKIADYFNISLDSLFFGGGDKVEAVTVEELPDDNKLRVIQCRGRVLLKSENHSKKEKFLLRIPHTDEKILNFEIWGSADIEGDISGNADAGAGINCSNIGGNADAGAGINCGNIGGNADAGAGINCGNIGGNVDAGGGVNCGQIGRNVDAGGDIHCSDIMGDAHAGRKIECRVINGKAECEGDIIIKKD